MSNVEYINGVKYINGYLCNGAGRPITISNGYSSEDEKEASEHYLEAKKEMGLGLKDKKPDNSKKKPDNSKKKSTPHIINPNNLEF